MALLLFFRILFHGLPEKIFIGIVCTLGLFLFAVVLVMGLLIQDSGMKIVLAMRDILSENGSYLGSHIR